MVQDFGRNQQGETMCKLLSTRALTAVKMYRGTFKETKVTEEVIPENSFAVVRMEEDYVLIRESLCCLKGGRR
jgi:hypothetical protein